MNQLQVEMFSLNIALLLHWWFWPFFYYIDLLYWSPREKGLYKIVLKIWKFKAKMYGVFLHNNNILKFKATFDVYFVDHLASLNG